MSVTWSPEGEPDAVAITAPGWVRACLRGAAVAAAFAVGALIMAVLRLVERPLFGPARPWTSPITPAVSRITFAILGMRREVTGARMTQPGAVVANHASWLDILALFAAMPVYFVAKSEVARWPVIGALSRMAGTVFIARERSHAHAQRQVFEDRLAAGHRLLFFPEGTSTDGCRVLPFKSTLFEAFFSDALRSRTHIQPVTVVYEAPPGRDPRFYGWWGSMALGPHLLRVLAERRNGTVRVIFHPPVEVAAFAGRKALAGHLEITVRSGMPSERQRDG